MLKSCSYCGRIHDTRFECERKKQAEQRRFAKRKETEALIFRKSKAWTNKSIQIRQRDNYLCLCCKALLEGTIKQYNTAELSVHHIRPINEDYSLRLDDANLITVCEKHHEMCESGKISREIQLDLVKKSIKVDENDDYEVVF